MGYITRWEQDAAAAQIPNWQKYIICQIKGSEEAAIFLRDEQLNVRSHWKQENYEKAFEWLKAKLLWENNPENPYYQKETTDESV